MATTLQLYSLFHAGGQPLTAHQLEPSLTINEYFVLVLTDEFKEFCDAQLKNYFDYFDGLLLHRLYKLQTELNTMSPADKNYPSLNKEYCNLIKTTSPVLEKLARISKETTTWDNLELVIE